MALFQTLVPPEDGAGYAIDKDIPPSVAPPAGRGKLRTPCGKRAAARPSAAVLMSQGGAG